MIPGDRRQRDEASWDAITINTTALMRITRLAALIAVLSYPSISVSRADDPTLDIVIKNGKIVDGSGAPWYLADVGIDDGKIIRIGNIPPGDAEEVIDAQGLVVAPGFIDMMGQTASPMVDDPKTAINLLTQGITTINAGEGNSAAPLSAQEGARKGATRRWPSTSRWSSQRACP